MAPGAGLEAVPGVERAWAADVRAPARFSQRWAKQPGLPKIPAPGMGWRGRGWSPRGGLNIAGDAMSPVKQLCPAHAVSPLAR